MNWRSRIYMFLRVRYSNNNKKR